MCLSSNVYASRCLGFHKEYLILVQPTLMATCLLGVFALQGARLMIREIKLYGCSLGCASEISTWLCHELNMNPNGQVSPEVHI